MSCAFFTGAKAGGVQMAPFFSRARKVGAQAMGEGYYTERRFIMNYTSPKAELLYPESEAVLLGDVLGASQEGSDNNFNITDLLG